MSDPTGPQRPAVPGDGWVEVDLPFPGVRQFEEEFAPNLATDGLFIPTAEPLPPSTVVRFHVTLPDEFVLLEGTGVVVWTRPPGDPSGAPPGMSLRFATLSQHYQDLLDRIVQTHVERGGVPFEIEPRVGGDTGVGEATPSPSPAARGVASERPRLTVRAAGAPGEVAPEGEGWAPVGPFDQTVRLEPRQPVPAAETLDTLETGASADEVSDPPPEPRWPPWEASEPPAPIATDLDREAERWDAGHALQDESGAADERPDTADPVARLPVPDELFTDDGDLDVGGEPATRDGAEVVEVSAPEPVAEAAPPRRWSMGRTIATLAAAIVVVGVVAVLVLSPWSRLVEPESDPSAAGGATAVGAGPVTAGTDDTTRAEPGESPLPVAEPGTGTDQVPEVAPDDAGAGAPAVVVAPDRAERAVESRPATRIESIRWSRAETATVVTLVGDGGLGPDRVAVIPMESPPRVLIRIRHIEARYESYVLEVGTPQVQAIRTGLHPELTPPALYVVCDLQDDTVRVLDTAFEGTTLTVTLGS